MAHIDGDRSARLSAWPDGPIGASGQLEAGVTQHAMPPPGQPLHVILHVPKCGGRTMQNHLRRHLGTQFWSVNKRFRHLPLEFFGRKYDSTPAHRLEHIRAVSGHFLGRSIEGLFPGRPLVRSLVLREPRSQVLSWYNFKMMRYALAGSSPYSFRLYLNSMPADPIAHFLLERWLELPWSRIASLGTIEKLQLLNSTLSQFDHVVDISKADQLIAWHSAALEIPGQAVRANDSKELAQQARWAPIGLAELTEAERAELDHHVQLDTYLWRKWALKQDVTFDSTPLSFTRKEFLRVVPQIRRRVARRFSLGTGLDRSMALGRRSSPNHGPGNDVCAAPRRDRGKEMPDQWGTGRARQREEDRGIASE
ncbi:MAG: hypothetical protein AB7L90_04080 [Hyphomicrobiaceae bacterium]